MTLPSLGALAIVLGKAFLAALCNDFGSPCVTSSRGAKGSKSSMPLYTPQLYRCIVSQVNWYLASPLSLAYTSLVLHPPFTAKRIYACSAAKPIGLPNIMNFVILAIEDEDPIG